MAEPFKNLINAALVQRIAAHLQAATLRFEARQFIAISTAGLGAGNEGTRDAAGRCAAGHASG